MINMLLLLILLNTHSMSMGEDFAATPTINVQEWQDFSALRVGDVICFKPSKEVAEHYAGWGHYGYRQTVCHRIFWRNSTMIGTWGDNRQTNKYPDFGYVDRKNYVGMVR